jgi:hypothetical protein
VEKNPNFKNSIYLQKSPKSENSMVNESEEEDFQFLDPNKYFLFN